MSKAQILAELPKLPSDDRSEILERLWELQEQELKSVHQRMVDEAIASGPARPATDEDWQQALQRGLKHSRKPV